MDLPDARELNSLLIAIDPQSALDKIEAPCRETIEIGGGSSRLGGL
jgi:hypothetical protein